MKANPLETGVVTISLDTELGWARINSGEYADVASRLDEGRAGIRQLLGAFDEYDIPATWAIVGQLLADSEPSDELERLPTVADDIPWERDWWRMPSLVEEIQAAEADHEVASHSGSHLLYDSLDPSEAREDLEDFRRLVPGGVTSFVFPQNRLGNRETLRSEGYQCYRGLAGKLAGAPTPTPLLPRKTDGLVDIPLSAGYRHFNRRHTLLARLPVRAKVWLLKLGTWRAARSGEVFHVVLHPNDFTLADGERLLDGFRDWLEYVAKLRDRGAITVSTIANAARAAEW